MNRFQFLLICLRIALVLFLVDSCKKDDEMQSNQFPLQCIVSNLQFAEGPAYLNGDLYFSDINANKIYRWNPNEGLVIFINNSDKSNGLYFNSLGKLIVCQGGSRQIVSIDQNKQITVLSDKFNTIAYNEPNDLWVSPRGDIYFSDPVFTNELSQPGEYVYCILASTGNVIKVAEDLEKPNGIIGTKDGTKLYIADYGASKIYQYTIVNDGTLTEKKLFADIQADGLSIDQAGNVYAASNSVTIYNSSGQLIKSIEVPGTITNLCIVEGTEKTAYITTHTNVYKQVIN